MSIEPRPDIGFSSVEEYLRSVLESRGISKPEIDEILKEQNKALTSKYNRNIKKQYHESDVMSAYNRYVSDVTPMIKEIKRLTSISNASKNNVENAKITSGSNSEEEVAASKTGSDARIRIGKIKEQIYVRFKEYEQEKNQAVIDAGKQLIAFYNLPVLSKSGGGRKTRKSKYSKRSRRMRRKA